MDGLRWAALAAMVIGGAQAEAQRAAVPAPEVRTGGTFSEVCAALTVEDTCGIVREAALMLRPSYEPRKATDGKAAFEAMGYNATYIPAKAGWLQGTTDVFLVSRPGSNRLFIVITGTEDARDWYENAKFRSYTSVYKDGQFYVPPAHAGFRRGMLNIVNDHVIGINEYDAPVGCPREGTRRSAEVSALTLHLCKYGLPRAPGAVQAVVVGHSRGAGIGIAMATAFAGLEIVRPVKGGPATVARQSAWPLALQAVVAFSPPHAVYYRSDRERGMSVPEGIEDQWTYLAQEGIPDRTIAFVDERDIVPNLSMGLGRQFGHRFRIRRDGAVVYEGTKWTPDADLVQAHSSHGYCRHVLGIPDAAPAPQCPDPPEPLAQ